MQRGYRTAFMHLTDPVHEEMMAIQKLAALSITNQVEQAEAISQGKLRLNNNGDGMLDATPPATDVIAITHRNSVSSPLLRLPAEVRNKIFAYVNSGLHIFMRAGHGEKPTILIKNSTQAVAPPKYPPYRTLQCTCRQVYNETALLPFSTNEKELPVIGNFDVRRLEGLKAFSRLKEVTFYLNTEHPNAERRFEDVKMVLEGYLKEVVSADVKIVYEHRYREADFVLWPAFER
ncbi:uncharacterized protein J4E78_004432 [Alternaria triticimaculans]|uniref:uncharacterized protein n=1 Tax=Alternaria triticimaculans TaxID=297637 RepID=UPI0020C36283|nr:uncharacterized protein J4E78_004432 [Alternaria triticimaculans]KAI4661643.1 hypothetical protein J4E78_004432 [Alternaria triticimaculans]